MRSLVTAVRSASGTGIWHGASGDAFRELLEDFPTQIDTCETSYATARDAMNWWAGRIEDHQASADRGLEQARTADQDLRAAQIALDTALTNTSRTSAALERIERDAIRYRNTTPPVGVTIPTPAQIATARRASSQAATAQTSAARAASDAQTRLDVAARLVAEAAASYEADAATTISRIENASEQALPENSLWEKIYRSDAWHVIVTIATVVVIIAAVAAFILTGPIAALVAGIALVASVVLVADELLAFSAGEGSWWQLGLALLSFVPGGALLKGGKLAMGAGERMLFAVAPDVTAKVTATVTRTARLADRGITVVRRFVQPVVDRANRAILSTQAGQRVFTPGARWTTQAARQEWIDTVPATKPANGTADWAAYQRTHAGTTEYKLTSRTDDEIWADGLRADPHAGAALEAKYVSKPGKNALYEGALPRDLQIRLMRGFDREMPRYAAAIADQGNPITRLEIITSTEQAGQYLYRRARALIGPSIPIDIKVTP
jgi:hypothetical protein